MWGIERDSASWHVEQEHFGLWFLHIAFGRLDNQSPIV